MKKAFLSFYIIVALVASIVVKDEVARSLWLITMINFGYKLVELSCRR